MCTDINHTQLYLLRDTVYLTVRPTPIETLQSLHFRHVTIIHGICSALYALSTTSFHVFLNLPLCLASSASKVTHSFTQSSSSFLEQVYTITMYFFVPLLQSSIPNSMPSFLTKHPSNHSYFCPMQCCSFSRFTDHISLHTTVYTCVTNR